MLLNLKPITCLLLMFFALASCENDFDETIADENDLNQESKINLTLKNGAVRTLTFKESLSLTASVIAKTLLEDRNARTEVLALYSSGNYIPLSQFIGADVANNSSLKSGVIASLNLFLTIGQPEHGILIPPPPGDNFISEEDYTTEFLKYMLDENCVEIYFPNKLTFGGSAASEITSVSHPLTDRFSNTGVIYSIVSQGYLAKFAEVDDNYLTNNSTVIVARPVRDQTCQYKQYSSVPDFRRFLSNE